MKKNLLIIAAIVAVAFSNSCQKEAGISNISTDGDLVSISFNAVNNDTKVSYSYSTSTSNYAASWTDGDIVKVNIEGYNYDFTKGSDNTFSGKIYDFTNQTVSAYWPSTTSVSFSADKSTIHVDAPTTVAVGANDYTGSLMVAQSANVSGPSALTSMTFNQAMAIIKLQIIGFVNTSKVDKIIIKANDAQALVESADISLSTGLPTNATYSDEINIAVTDGKVGYNTILNIPVIPSSIASTYTISVYNGSTLLGSYTTKSVTFTKNTIYSLNLDCCNVATDSRVADIMFSANNKLSGFTNMDNVTTYYNEKMGYVPYFNSNWPYIENSESLYDNLKNGYTLEVFACSNKILGSEWGYIFGATSSGGFVIGQYYNQLRFAHHNGSGYQSLIYSNLSVNHWYHLVASWDKSYLNFYVNGNLVGQISCTSLKDPVMVTGVDKSFTIGANHPLKQSYASDCFNGYIGNIRVWNKALTADELSVLSSCAPVDYEKDECKAPN